MPLLLIGYGFTSLDKGIVKKTDREFSHELLELYPGFSTTLDNKLQFAPVVSVYALNLLGVRGRNNAIKLV
ncbi:MAG: hypothetical protein WKF68_14005 [Daejeonella sp.]